MINNKININLVRQFNDGWKGYTLEAVRIITPMQSFEELSKIEEVGLKIEEWETNNNQVEISLYKESYENLLTISDIKAVVNKYSYEINEKLREAGIEKYNLDFDLYLDHNAYWLDLSEEDIHGDSNESAYIGTTIKVNLNNTINAEENTLTINGYSVTIPISNNERRNEVLWWLGKLPANEAEIRILKDIIKLKAEFGGKYNKYKKLNNICEFNQEIESISYIVNLMLEESDLDNYELVIDIA